MESLGSPAKIIAMDPNLFSGSNEDNLNADVIKITSSDIVLFVPI